ncbi:hypothetical protein [Roseibium sediminicola]|uniref:TolB amino-terminal domain-containing protein n=1 Tax=Roseibium sediminicola TaxID=2933272 RepID=A0ABT0GPN2_9HYPH|nr:hypothetical protein [Roseibium sp. CAU 1639]MCK7611373.1 hypothetical protein [Roseibium sp. CAU 1639]
MIALLALLATAPDGMRMRAWLQERLWSLSGAELGRASLRRALSDLRKVLGDEFDRIFKVSNTSISLRPGCYHLIGDRSEGEFLEGLAVSEPEFQKWLSQQRAGPPFASAAPVQTSGIGFASPTVAVIPFTFLNTASQNEMLGDVLAQEMTRSLSRANLFIVFSHLLGRQLQSPETDLGSLTASHPIDFVVYGTVRATRDLLEIDVDIADARSGRLCGTHACPVSIAQFLEGKSDIVSDMTRQIAESIVVDMIGQKLSSEVPGHTSSWGKNNTLRNRAEKRAKEVCDASIYVEQLMAQQPRNSEFHSWLRRWYVEHLERSGVEAIRSRSGEKARTYFQKALEIANDFGEQTDRDQATGRLLLLLGPQLSINHGFASTEVQEVYEKANQQYSGGQIDTDQRLQMIWGLWGAEIVKANISGAELLSSEFLEIACDRSGSMAEAAGQYMCGVGAFYFGDFVRAESVFLKAVELAQRADFHEMITRYGMDLHLLSSCYLGWCYALMGRTDKTAKAAHDIEAHSARSDHAFSQALSYCFLSTMHNFLGNLGKAKTFGLRASSLSRRHGFAQQASHARVNLGRVRDRSGHASGLHLLQEGLRAYAETGAVLARPYAEAWIAEALIDRREEKDALDRVLKARRFACQSGERYFDAELLRIAALAVRGKRPEPSRRTEVLLRKSLDQARCTGANLHLLKTMSDLERCRLGSNEGAPSTGTIRLHS